MRTVAYGMRPVGAATMVNDDFRVLSLRPRDAAKALGISPRLLWQLTKDGEIPCVRVGTGQRQSILYPITVLQVWLSEKATKGGAK